MKYSVSLASPIVACCLFATTDLAIGAVRLVPQNYHTIQAGINAAQTGDIVLVAPGTYTGDGNRDLNLMGKAITLQGSGGADATILNVQGTPQRWHMGFHLHMQETPATVIQGFTIINGYTFNGAGMSVVNSSPTIRNCVFKDNYVLCWGGAMYYDGNSNVLVSDCKFISNTSAAEGGAVFGLNGAPVFSNCLFTDNGANTGGAFLTFGNESPKIINSTIVGNFAPWGSAIATNNLKITNSIISDNAGSPDQIDEYSGSTTTVEFSIVQCGFEGNGNIDANPDFVDSDKLDFHLSAGSPGIDAGDPAQVVEPGSVDLDGDPRMFGQAIDMGIDEFRKFGDVNGDHMVNVTDLLTVINGWGPCTQNLADFDGNFTIDVNDLLVVINNWG